MASRYTFGSSGYGHRRLPADDGEPFIVGGRRVGTKFPDGSIVFNPGISVTRLPSEGDQAPQPQADQPEPDHVEKSAGDGHSAAIGDELEAVPDLLLQRVIDPLADAEGQKTKADQHGGYHLRGDGCRGDGDRRGDNGNPPMAQVDALEPAFHGGQDTTFPAIDPSDPRHLPPAQQIALLTLRGGALAQACVSALRANGAPSPNEMDYIALARASLSVRQSNNRRALTPRGKYRADELARAIATTTDIHICAYGRSPGAWHVRCSCGFFASNATAIRDLLTKVMAAATQHLAHVGKLPMPERAKALAELWACPAVDGRSAPTPSQERP